MTRDGRTYLLQDGSAPFSRPPLLSRLDPAPVCLERLCAFLGLACEPGLEDYGANPQALAERQRKHMGEIGRAHV